MSILSPQDINRCQKVLKDEFMGRVIERLNSHLVEGRTEIDLRSLILGDSYVPEGWENEIMDLVEEAGWSIDLLVTNAMCKYFKITPKSAQYQPRKVNE